MIFQEPVSACVVPLNETHGTHSCGDSGQCGSEVLCAGDVSLGRETRTQGTADSRTC